MDMQSSLKYSAAKLNPAIMWLWNIIQPETIGKNPRAVWPVHSTPYESLTFEGTWKNWRLCEMQMRIPRGEILLSDVLVFSSLEGLLQTSLPVSAPNVSKAKGLCSEIWGTACCWPACHPRGKEEMMGRRDFWSVWLIKARATKECLDWKSSRSVWSQGNARERGVIHWY